MNSVWENILPLFLIMGLGLVAGKFKILNDNIIDGIKGIIIRIALPGVLFLSFSQADLNPDYIFIILIMFIFCCLLYLIGGLLHKIFPNFFSLNYNNAFFTAFEFGMIGVALFSLIWGMEMLPVFALVGFGHELFVWFVYIPLLESRQTGKVEWKKTASGFIKSPVAWGILTGILFNLTGWINLLEKNPAGTVIINTISMMGGVISPLILMVIGYMLRSSRLPEKKSIIMILGRVLVIAALGIPSILLIKLLIPDIDPLYIEAFIAFVLLPPSYILPLMIADSSSGETKVISESLVLYTLLFLFAISLLVIKTI